MFLVNADDRGFVDNALELANTLDQCEENFDNVLFQLKYRDTIKELVDKRLLYDFVDKVGNHVYLIRHWFIHNKYRNGLMTNYLSYLTRVEISNGKYQFKVDTNKEYKDSDTSIKVKQNKLNQNKLKQEIEINVINKEKESEDDEKWEDSWDNFLTALKDIKGS